MNRDEAMDELEELIVESMDDQDEIDLEQLLDMLLDSGWTHP